MKKIRMTACVLILTLTVCVLAGCSNQNGGSMADEATTASQSAPNGQNGTATETGGAGTGTNGTGGTTGNMTGGTAGTESFANPGNAAGTNENESSSITNQTDTSESTGVVDGLLDDVERTVE